MKIFKEKNKTGSITKRVIWYLFLISFIIFILIELFILERSYHALLSSLDQTIKSKAEAFVSLTEYNAHGKIELDFSDEIMPEYSGKDPRAYFLILRDSDNYEIERSRSLMGWEPVMPVPLKELSSKQSLYWSTFHNDKEIRFIALRAKVTPEKDEADNNINYSKHIDEEMCIFIVGVDMRDVNSQFRQILILTCAALGAGLLFLIMIGRFILLYNLKPLRNFRDEVESISVSNLVPVSVPPVREIAGIADTLNIVIDNLRNSFDRERQFTSNVAHELRTPISEIRSTAEVALKWPENLDAQSLENFENILDAAKQMQITVDNLLTLSRLDSGTLKYQSEMVEILPMINSIWESRSRTANERGIAINNSISSNFFIFTDINIFQLIMENLLSNAVEYSCPDSVIDLSAGLEGEYFLLSISNPAEDLFPEDLPHIFERFWRKDKSRTSDSAHSGLGLSLVQSLAELLKFKIETSLSKAGLFTISISGNHEKI